MFKWWKDLFKAPEKKADFRILKIVKKNGDVRYQAQYLFIDSYCRMDDELFLSQEDAYNYIMTFIGNRIESTEVFQEIY